jgi:hypothetical protein
MAVQAVSKTPGGLGWAYLGLPRHWNIPRKSQVLTSEQTDGNRDGTVPLVNPITTAPRLVTSQAGLFTITGIKSPSRSFL